MTRCARAVAGLLLSGHTYKMLEGIKAARDYFREEGDVIRQAPVAFLVGCLLVGAIVFAVIDWHFSGQVDTLHDTIDNQKTRIDMQNDKIVELQRKVEGISPNPIPPPKNTESIIKRLDDESNDKIKLGVTQFIKELRTFDAAFDVQDREVSDAQWRGLIAIPFDQKDKKQEEWNSFTNGMLERRTRHDADFNTRFRSPALAYREAICNRVQFTSPCPSRDMRSLMLDVGIYAGPHPIMEIADYLDEISRKLK